MDYRLYNENIDDYYSPDDTPHLFLSEEQINEALANLKHYSEQSEIEAKALLKRIEQLNRQEKLGEITPEKCLDKNKELVKAFADKHGFWPYITKTYQDFYEFFRKSKY